MRINELVEKSGTPRTTIHYYLREGLLHPPRKTGRTTAFYDETHLQRLKQINDMKKGTRLPISFLKEQIANLNPSENVAPDFDVTKTVKTTKEKERKREEIMKAAIRVFSRLGYHQTKVSDIAKELKISTGSFYLYFQNKRELFIDVIDQVFKAIVGEAAVAIKGEENYFERMRIRGRVFFENYTRYNEILNQLRAEIASEEEWPREKLKKIYEGLTNPVIREIKDAIKQGLIRPVDPELLAYTLTGLIEITSFRLSLDSKYTYEDVEIFIDDLYVQPMLLK
ncbi:MAG: TetR family transcriptional regulator [Desulfobacteraceae bacterium]|nr:TetR family transcriptional regulator [Desulfobacteraceae bacterium]